ncbi:hypothetical protein pipiens_017243, partial [Culex pipiens pipiens]
MILWIIDPSTWYVLKQFNRDQKP